VDPLLGAAAFEITRPERKTTMSNVGGVSGSSNVYGVSQLDVTGGMSPDALLSYCQMQMDSLNGQIGGLMQQMQQQTNDEQTVKSLQSQLEQFGSNGPGSTDEMQKAYNDYQQAINSMPQGDPTRDALQQACTNMCNAYGFTPAQPLTADQQQQLQQLQTFVSTCKTAFLTPTGFQNEANAQAQIGTLLAQQNGSGPTTKPDSTSWQGTTDAVGSIASTINSNAQMQMLEMQNLASQQQNATELSIQLLQKADSTLLDIAKNA
jgi:hypothetical protein